VVGSTLEGIDQLKSLVDIDQLKALVNRPKWIIAKGILVFPHYKPSQKIRASSDEKTEIWLPDFKDTITLAYLHHLYALNNGSVRREGELWISSHGVMGNDLADVLVESFLKL